MTVPAPGSLALPDLVRRVADGRPAAPVWRNELGGSTWSLGNPAEEYLKVGPPHRDFAPGRESDRMFWAGEVLDADSALAVPEVLGVEPRGPEQWLHTSALPGANVVGLGLKYASIGDRAGAARALGRALRIWHDSVPVDACPFTWSVEDRIRGLSPGEAGRVLRRAPDLDPVVCHGDACSPNFLFEAAAADHGETVRLTPTGVVDLGYLGVGDRWADLAPALLSCGWNLGEGFEEALLAGYGIARDVAKLEFYTALYELGA